MKIIGLSGTNGSGKDTVAQIIAEKYDFLFVSSTDLIDEELKKRGLSGERANKRIVTAEWRAKNPSAVVDKAVSIAKESNKNGLVVGSIRHPAEAKKIHELGGKLIWVDAESALRYQRITSVNRGRVEDKKSYEDFLAEEAEEMDKNSNTSGLDVGKVKSLANIHIENNSTNKALGLQINNKLDKILN